MDSLKQKDDFFNLQTIETIDQHHFYAGTEIEDPHQRIQLFTDEAADESLKLEKVIIGD